MKKTIETIIENGIRVYKNIICKCGCGKRLPFSESHYYNRISECLRGHHNGSYKKGHKPTHGFKSGKDNVAKLPEIRKILSKKSSGICNNMYGIHMLDEDSPRFIDGCTHERHNFKNNSIRRELGYKSINKPFKGCSGHHINNQVGIYIPLKLHKSMYHSQKTGKGMKKMNKLAFQWLEDNTIESQRSLLEFK